MTEVPTQPHLGPSPLEPIRVPTALLPTSTLRDRAQARVASLAYHRSLIKQPYAYGHNTVEGHMVGILGENATEWWTRQHHTQVERISEDRNAILDRRGDIELTYQQPMPRDPADIRSVWHGLEVKAARSEDWKTYATTVPDKQLRRTRARAYVWCVIGPDPATTESVFIMGWLPTSVLHTDPAPEVTEIRGEPYRRIRRPPQPPSALFAYLASLPPDAARAADQPVPEWWKRFWRAQP